MTKLDLLNIVEEAMQIATYQRRIDERCYPGYVEKDDTALYVLHILYEAIAGKPKQVFDMRDRIPGATVEYEYMLLRLARE